MKEAPNPLHHRVDDDTTVAAERAGQVDISTRQHHKVFLTHPHTFHAKVEFESSFDAKFRSDLKLNTSRRLASIRWLRPWMYLTNNVAEGSTHSAPKGVLIDLLVPPTRAEDMLFALQKTFEDRWVPKYGRRFARKLFLVQSTGAVCGFWIDWVRQRLDILKLFAR